MSAEGRSSRRASGGPFRARVRALRDVAAALLAPVRASAVGALLCAAFAASASSGAEEPAPRFGLPIRCTLGEDCFVQNYVDRDPGPGWRDFQCGHLSYDGHHGTDFRLLDLAQMRRGVAVVAAAPGVVVAVRDGEPDVPLKERGRDAVAKREAGNAVRIAHSQGWETQYSHMRQGSVRVRPGQRVEAGEELGLVGLSGKTEFPHVDFTVRKDGFVRDPFSPGASAECGRPDGSLWRPELGDALKYRAVGLLLTGWAPEPADRATAERGDYRDSVRVNSPSLVFFVEVFGARAGDRERIEVLGPDGRRIAEHQREVERHMAVRYSYAGRRRSGDAWPPGTYTANYVLERDGETVVSASRALELR